MIKDIILKSLLTSVIFGMSYNISNAQWKSDHLGDPLEFLTIELGEDYEGRVISTLIRSIPKGSSNNSAILYIHGFNDYFFQKELAQEMNFEGWDFYAVDLRKYGRSYLSHQRQGNIRDLEEYYQEIDSCLSIINSEGYERVVLMGHSTGGLIASLYAADREDSGSFEGVILNSPFLDMNLNWFLEHIAVPFVSGLGHLMPNAKITLSSSNNYARSIHSDMDGEWDFNLGWKPAASIPINFGWIKAIHKGHKRVQKGIKLPKYGLKIELPVLVLHSDKSVKESEWSDRFKNGDCVLDVEDIAKYSKALGSNVSTAIVKDGIHDLALSRKDVREEFYDLVIDWLSTIDSRE